MSVLMSHDTEALIISAEDFSARKITLAMEVKAPDKATRRTGKWRSYHFCVIILHGTSVCVSISSGVTIIKYFGIRVPCIPHTGLLPLVLLSIRLWRLAKEGKRESPLDLRTELSRIPVPNDNTCNLVGP